MNDSTYIVYITFPSTEEAERIGRILIENHLAACVNILGPCTSLYRWNNTIEQQQEIVAIAKTTHGNYPQLEKTILEEHPYEVPCITAIDIKQGHAPFLEWINSNTQSP